MTAGWDLWLRMSPRHWAIMLSSVALVGVGILITIIPGAVRAGLIVVGMGGFVLSIYRVEKARFERSE